MADFLLRLMGSAAVASLVVTGVMVYELSMQLSGHSKQPPRRLQKQRDRDPPDP